MDTALMRLFDQGGLAPLERLRDRNWQRAKLLYDIAKKRQTKVRIRDQLRAEQEEVWNEAHERFYSQRQKAATVFQNLAECPVCVSMNACYPTKVTYVQPSKDKAWWEQPKGLVSDHVLVPRTPLRPVREPRQPDSDVKPSVMRRLIQDFRRITAASEAQRRMWEIRYRTESAVRRKHGLGEDFQAEQVFWDSPISGVILRQNYQSVQESQRMAERRARGHMPRPKLPRSSLSYSESSAEVEVDESMLERMRREEEEEELQREIRKVGGQVGYLYFVGSVDGLKAWREDYLRSDRQLVHRRAIPRSESNSSISEADESESEDELEDMEMDE